MKKKSMLLSLGIFFLTISILPQSISFTAPVRGTNWIIGNSYDITWRSAMIPASTDLKINIFKNSVDPGNFVEQLITTNDGTESWAIGAAYTPGNYVIRIKTVDNLIYSDSETFLISGLTLREVSDIHISSPSPSIRWCKNRAYTIRWSATGVGSLNMSILLMNPTTRSSVMTISSNTPNDGSFPIPASTLNDVTPGSYIIRVKTVDNSTIGDSDRFQIADCSADLEYSPVLVYNAPAIIPNSAELSIEEMRRTDTKPVRTGEILGFSVRVKNIGRNSANICITTPNGKKSQNFYQKGECGIINGQSERSYSINIPINRGMIRDLRAKINVFLSKADKNGLLGNILWKDSNSRNNFKTVEYPASLPDLIVKEISEVKYGYIASNRWQWTTVKVKVKNQGNYISETCKITLQGYSTDSRYGRYPCNSPGRIIMDVPAIPAGNSITGYLPTTCRSLGYPRNKFDIEVIVNPQNVALKILESNYNNNKLKINVSRLNAVEDNSSAPSSWDATWERE